MIAAEGLSGTRRGRRGVIEVVEGRADERPRRVGGEKQGRGGRRGEVGVEREGGYESGSSAAAAKCYWHFVRTKLVRFTLFIWLKQ